MNKKSTNELDALLRDMNPKDLDNYYKENRDSMNTEKTFTYYVKDVIQEKNIRLKDVYSFAGLSESYGEQILNMRKHTKDRDVVIRLCVAGRLTLDEINRALKLYGMQPLYAKDKRDACMIVAINNRKYQLFEIDDMLVEQGLKKLSPDEKN